MTNEELVKLLQELSGDMTCGKHVIELEQAADRIKAFTAENERLNKSAACLAETRRLAVKDVAELEAEVERLREEGEEAYKIGKQDGYSQAVQDVDMLTGGDREYRYCTDHDPERHTPDPETMKARIVARFQIETGGWKEAGQPWLWTYDPHLKEKKP
jgi:hypothetical protein